MEVDAFDNSQLAQRLDRLDEATVFVVGDVMLDRYVTGTVDRISPEAPIPVLKVTHENAMLGGAGNVLRNLRAVGAQARLAAVVGADDAGAQVRALMSEAGCDAAGLHEVSDRPTSVKVRYLAGGQQLLRSDHERVGALNGETRARILDSVTAALDGVGVVVLSDYGKGVLSEETAAEVIAQAKRAGIPVVVDPKGQDYTRYRGAAVITPNRRELAEASGLATDTDSEIEAAGRAVIERSGVDAVLATRSERGMTLLRAGAPPLHLPTHAREVFDVSGAGDTVVAVLAAALAAGAALDEAARLANVAAGIVVGKVGTAVARREEILRALHAARLLQGEDKVAEPARALEEVEAWRRAGLRVGFTNGCFDLLHPGHVSLLKQARKACDRLIVGLNADASVQRLKGPSRPVQDEAARAAVLASLASVDLVVVFPEDTPLRLLQTLRPDVLVKGADYTRESVVGGDLVESYGGRVVLADLSPGHSTSETIRRLRS